MKVSGGGWGVRITQQSGALAIPEDQNLFSAHKSSGPQLPVTLALKLSYTFGLSGQQYTRTYT